MATDTNILMGKVVDDPKSEEKDVEKLLLGFLRSLLEEQQQSTNKDRVKHIPSEQT